MLYLRWRKHSAAENLSPCSCSLKHPAFEQKPFPIYRAFWHIVCCNISINMPSFHLKHHLSLWHLLYLVRNTQLQNKSVIQPQRPQVKWEMNSPGVLPGVKVSQLGKYSRNHQRATKTQWAHTQKNPQTQNSNVTARSVWFGPNTWTLDWSYDWD